MAGRSAARDAPTGIGVGSIDEPTRVPYASTVSSPIEPTTPTSTPRPCFIADALDVVGERWSLLIVRELGLGVTRFGDLRTNTGAPRETLTVRLRKLEEAGIVERRRYQERPPRDEYALTDAGRALAPVLRALREWGEQHGARAGGDV